MVRMSSCIKFVILLLMPLNQPDLPEAHVAILAKVLLLPKWKLTLPKERDSS